MDEIERRIPDAERASREATRQTGDTADSAEAFAKESDWVGTALTVVGSLFGLGTTVAATWGAVRWRDKRRKQTAQQPPRYNGNGHAEAIPANPVNWAGSTNGPLVNDRGVAAGTPQNGGA